MARLLLTLLGAFEVDLDGQPVTAFEYDKVRALLAYLAVEADRPHRREMVAELLWPKRSERSARQNLSQALFKLRHLLDNLQTAPPFLLVTPQTLQFNPVSDYQLDVTTFTNLLVAGQSHAHDRLETCWMCRAQLRQAVTLYRGDFLKGFSLGDSPAFEEWSVLTREQLHRLAGEALGRLVSFFESEGAYDEALTYAWRQVELEPWREDNRRMLMRLLALSGQRRAALAQYDTCCRLAEEIGIEPEAETTALHEEIRAGKLSGVTKRKARDESNLKPEESTSNRKPVVTHYPLSPAPFVGRETQLACLDNFLNTVLTGRGQIVFVTGDPGQGKTALIGEFIRRAQATQPHLIVVGGKGNAYTGSGDPYLPFREVLALLTGDIEAQWAAGAVSQEDADRLWHLLPHSIRALLEVGPDLIGSFLPAEALLKRAQAFRPELAKPTWTHLNQLVERLTAPGDPATRPQSDLFEQYSRVLRWLAQHKPLLLVLDDLQWVDHGSANLLFHLGQRIEASQILIVGAYRPAEVAIGHPEGRHPLEPVVNELKRLFGAIEIDLAEVEDRSFVDDLLNIEPNRLNESFRQTLFQQTRGHPLFTVELLRGMQERGDLVQDQQGCWIEGPTLDWETLPARVEAIIAERIERLPESWLQVLTAASVEGEIFTAEVMARVQGISELEMVHGLSDNLERIHRLVKAETVRWLGGQRLSQYRFRHILFQKYLYQHLDAAERVYFHEAIGTILEALYQSDTTPIAMQLARHFEEAGRGDTAP